MKWVYLLGYLAMPAVVIVHFWLGRDAGGSPRSWEPTATFILAGLSIIPLARLMGRATEHLAVRTGPTWGGLLNATFGNAAELIIGIVALSRGLNSVAKASLAGSILGNLLLVSGAAMLVGGWRRERQTFSRAGAEANAGLLMVAVTAMLLPAIYHLSFFRHPHLQQREQNISIGTSLVLLGVYGLGLLFTLRTHKHVFTPQPGLSDEDPAGLSRVAGKWSVRNSIIALFIASALVAVFSELLVGSVQKAADNLHLNFVFVGVILVAIIGNAAEHSTAVLLAHHNDMDTAMTITIQSSLQIALFVTPALVLLSGIFVWAGVKHAIPMNMVFSPLEVASVFLSMIIMVTISRNGESNWFEGTLLLAMYTILAITFFYIPTAADDGYDRATPAGGRNGFGEDTGNKPGAFEDLRHAASR